MIRDEATWDAVGIVIKAMADAIWDEKSDNRTTAAFTLGRVYTHLTFKEFAESHGYVPRADAQRNDA